MNVPSANGHLPNGSYSYLWAMWNKEICYFEMGKNTISICHVIKNIFDFSYLQMAIFQMGFTIASGLCEIRKFVILKWKKITLNIPCNKKYFWMSHLQMAICQMGVTATSGLCVIKKFAILKWKKYHFNIPCIKKCFWMSHLQMAICQMGFTIASGPCEIRKFAILKWKKIPFQYSM